MKENYIFYWLNSKNFMFRMIVFLVNTVILLGVSFRGYSQSTSETWKFECQRLQIAPVSAIDKKTTFQGKPTLRLRGGGKAFADGHWYKTMRVEPGSFNEFNCYYKANKVEEPNRSILARVIWMNNLGEPIVLPEYPATIQGTNENDWVNIKQTYKVPDEAAQAKLELHYRWDADGTVRFSEATFQKTTNINKRIVRIATIHHRPRNSKSALENLLQFSKLVAKAGENHADIVCLPEGITLVGTTGNYISASEPIPGATTKFLGSLAKQYKLYIVAGILEKEGEVVYNTAVLIDRDGNLAGKYRKVSLPQEEIDGGVTPGNSLPVFETDFGKIGMMICWDVTFPEVARKLSQQGAEVIFLPIWGGFLNLTIARALENQVYIVSSSYDMKSAIFDTQGNLLKEATVDSPVVYSDIDLNKQNTVPWIGDLKNRIPREIPPNKATHQKLK